MDEIHTTEYNIKQKLDKEKGEIYKYVICQPAQH